MVWNAGSTPTTPKSRKMAVQPTTPTTPTGTAMTRLNMPLTERQQMALIRQMTSPVRYPETPCTPKNSQKFNAENIHLKRLTKRNERGETRLHIAVIRGDVQQTKWLIKQGADVNAVDFAGWTPLHEACNHGWHEIAKCLLKAGADANAVGLGGDTPLHDASVNGHIKLVKLLLKYKAAPLLVNSRGKNPLDVAANAEIALLLKGGKNPSKENLEQGCSAKIPGAEVDGKHKSDNVSAYQLTEDSFVCHQPHWTLKVTSEKTMRKNSPQHQAPKAPDKPISPRLTLRFQPIRTKDDKHGEGSKSNAVSSSEPRYQSYCVTMETREDIYEFKKGDTPVSSTGSSSSPDSDLYDSQLNVVSSSKDTDSVEQSENLRGASSKTKTENHTHGQLSSQIEKLKFDHISEYDVKSNNAKMTGEGSNHIRPDYEDVSEGEQDDGRKKRRRESKDSTDSRHSVGSSASLRSHSIREKNIPSNINSRDDKRNLQELQVSAKGVSGSDTESTQSDVENESEMRKNNDTAAMNSVGNSCHQMSPKVPPLKIVIPTTSILEQDRDRCKNTASKQALPYIVTTMADSVEGKSEGSNSHDGSNFCDKENKDDQQRDKGTSGGPEERYQRVTRSSQRMAALASASTSLQSHSISMDNSSNQDSQKLNSGDGSSEEQISVDVHPRKRKLRPRDGTASDSSGIPSTSAHSEEQPVMNCYEMYLNIKKQVDRRRKNMYVVQPKPPQGFKDYLMNRCSYVLAGNAASRLSVPMIPPPQSLTGSMRDLFIGQEKERYKLRLQHIIEKEKLVLAVEQEILRVHGRAARALANQTIPLSVCAVLKDEEIYNQIEPDQLERVSSNMNISHHFIPLEDKDRNARTRYNGRLFLSWLQDVDDKWEKIKEAMLLRHHNEAESLHAVQKLDWEWKMKEMGVCDAKSTPVIDDIHVPMVHVSDDFDLLPA